MISTKQRFRSDRPCPVCGGHANLSRGKGRRCYGYLSEDGSYAHCTREEHAGPLDRNPNSNSFAHLLRGVCQCGKEHGATTAPAQLQSGGGQGSPSVNTYRHFELGKPAQLWTYRYANGAFACYVARWNVPGEEGEEKEYRPLVLQNRRWKQKGLPVPRPLYNLPMLYERPNAPVLVVEGEKTSDAVRDLLPSYIPTTSMFGADAPHWSDWTPLKGREVVIWPDNDPDGQLYARSVAALVLKAGASGVRIVHLPEGLPAKWDLADPVPASVDPEALLAEAEPYVADEEEPDTDERVEGQGGRLSSGDLLLRWAREFAELFCDGEEAFADVLMDGQRKTLPIRSTGFKRWLRRLHWERTGKGATQEALTHAVENLDAQAALAGQRRVYLRTASHEGSLYIDLGDDSQRVVEVDAEGWRVLREPPGVRFRRTLTTEALPAPARGDPSEGISTLRGFLNVGDEDFVLCVAWLLASLRDTGPYPVLVLTGEQGSAKSTAARLLRSLVDPARPPTRGMPRDERDAVIAARRRHVLVYDNLSGLPVWLSDTFCRLSTGEGYATRALFTDDDEVVFEACRPVILTGIENSAVRGDLADRSIVIRLDPIAERARRTESEVMAAFEEARPRILGALLDGLSEGLRKYGSIRLERLPRMADFFRWVVACEGAYWPSGTFMATYRDAQASAMEDVLEESPIGPALRRFLEEAQSFDGSAEELLGRLDPQRPEGKHSKGWPSTRVGMGKQLNRLAPSMRKLGYTADRRKTNRENRWRLEPPRQAGELTQATEEESDEANETA